ncbi:hypothetical protein ACFL4G_00610 [Thermodesulfobacteriota bacterium]
MKNFTVFALLIPLCLMNAFCQSRASKNGPPEGIELPAPVILDSGWFLQSSEVISAGGEVISSSSYTTEGWYPTDVPATILAALVENDILPDPYYSDNLYYFDGFTSNTLFRPYPVLMPEDSPYYPSWWFRTDFEVPIDYTGATIFLHLNGINYRANVWLNGTRIADEIDVVGMFRRYRFDVSEHVAIGGSNHLAVEVTGPGHDPSLYNGSKQIEATTGWDDHNPTPPDMNTGIWRSVTISAIREVEIKNPYVATDLDLPFLDIADLTISAEIQNHSHQQVTGMLQGEIEEIRFSKNVSLEPGEEKFVAFSPDEYGQLIIHNPRIWWPNNLGSQELYDLNLEFIVDGRVSDRKSVTFGIREADSYLNENGWRVFQINGRNIQIKGGAWMNADMLLDLSTRRYEAMIKYAGNANFNMLRSEGFTLRETDEFYRLCDENGILVTQQLFGRSIADEDLALACVKDTILRIRNHPSLVHFIGHDETFPTETLDEGYRSLIEQYAPERTYQPNSGAFDIEDRFETGGTRTGTLELWMYAYPARYYETRENGFYATGFAQSGGIGGIFCNIESARRMIPDESLWPYHFSHPFSFHTVTQGSAYYIPVFRAMRHRYGRSEDAEDFYRKGVVMNYECARAMFEAYGRNKGYTADGATGITTWKYNAAWPAALTWQYVDWYLVPTGAYYGAKKACEPLHVQYSYDDDSVYIVNAYHEEFTDLKVRAEIYNFDLSLVYDNEVVVSIGPDGKTEAFAIDWPCDSALSMSHFLSLELIDDQDNELTENFYWLSKVKDLPLAEWDWVFLLGQRTYMNHKDLQDLPNTTLDILSEMEDAGRVRVTISNPTDRLAFYIQVALRKGPGGDRIAPVYWEDNHFSLLPGRSKTILGIFSVEDFEGESPILSVEGWNIERVEYPVDGKGC